MVDSEKNLQRPERSYRFIAFAIICTLASATLSAAIDASLANSALSGASPRISVNSDHILSHLQYLVLLSILTATTEEIVFRGIVLRGLQKILSNMKALMISSVLFAILHAIPIGIESLNIEAIGILPIFVSLLLKFVQAFVFGIVMAGIVLRGGNLIIVSAVHTVFDIIYFAPCVLSTGSFPYTYVTVQPESVLLLIVSTFALLPAAVFALKGNDLES